jgi:3-(3-hydroxy-phenyl)propionate hydroxylase
MANELYDVAIIGLGPVGAAAAVLLADAGLSVIAFERDTDVHPLPRAVGMDGEVVRGFQRIGRGEEFAALLQPIRPGDRAGFANAQHEWLFGQELTDFGGNAWPPLSMFDQPEVDGYLRTTAARYPNTEMRLGYEVLGLTQDADGVTLRTRDLADASEQAHRARYVIACDGASSDVRRSLDIGWRDLGYDHDWLVVDVTVNDKHTLNLDTVQVCDPDRLVTYVATKDPYRRWEFKLNPGETADEMLEAERIQQLIDPWTPRDSYTIRRAAVYQFHAATAERWREGRILLAGDAAHQTPPFLGQGMNAGMRDVINLAWKLPLVLTGVADPALLDTYPAERSAHAADLVAWAVAIGELMEHLAAVATSERDGKAAPAVPADTRASGYGQGREAPPLRNGAVMVEQVSDTGSTGYLFNQPIVRDANGYEFRFDEQLGAGLAIVARTDADLQLSDASRALIDRLGMTVTSLEGLTTVRGHFDRLFDHAAAAVIRPDRYVFGHTSDALSLDELLAALAEKLHL